MTKIQNPVVLIHKRDNSDSYAVAITSGSQDYHDAVLMASMEPDMVGDDVDTWSKTGYYMAAEIERLRQQVEKLEKTSAARKEAIKRTYAWFTGERDRANEAEEKCIHLLALVDDYDWQRQRLHTAAVKVIGWNRQEAEDRTGDAECAESYACVRELRDALAFCESSRSGSAGATENCRNSENVQVVQVQSGAIPATEPVRSGDVVATMPVNDVTAGKPLIITLPDISSKAFWSGSGKTEVFHPETYRRWVKEAIERYCAIGLIDVEVK